MWNTKLGIDKLVIEVLVSACLSRLIVLDLCIEQSVTGRDCDWMVLLARNIVHTLGQYTVNLNCNFLDLKEEVKVKSLWGPAILALKATCLFLIYPAVTPHLFTSAELI